MKTARLIWRSKAGKHFADVGFCEPGGTVTVEDKVAKRLLGLEDPDGRFTKAAGEGGKKKTDRGEGE